MSGLPTRTLAKINIEPENEGLEVDFLFQGFRGVYCQVPC